MKDLDLFHFSEHPLVRVEDRKQELRRRLDKPEGLWLSVGTAWVDWCRDAQFWTQKPTHVTRVILDPRAPVLFLRGNLRTLLDFTREYTLADEYLPHPLLRHSSIDWPRVAERYDGIVIAPYCWEARHDVSWYYTWDCARGCIWNARAVAGLVPTVLANFEPEAKRA